MITAEELRNRQAKFKKQDIDRQLAEISSKLGEACNSYNSEITISEHIYPEVKKVIKSKGYSVYQDQFNNWVIKW